MRLSPSLAVVEAPQGVAAWTLLQMGLGWNVTGVPISVHCRVRRVPGDQQVPLGSGATRGVEEPEELQVPRESQAGR